jgi:hypothetical protein
VTKGASSRIANEPPSSRRLFRCCFSSSSLFLAGPGQMVSIVVVVHFGLSLAAEKWGPVVTYVGESVIPDNNRRTRRRG